MSRLTLPLKWHGGKAYLAPKIVAMMPRHRHYVEPYAGGLAVLLARDPNDKRLWTGETGNDCGVSEVVNDLDRELTNFWTCLQYPLLFAEMHRRLQCVPLSRWEWADARAFLDTNPMEPACDASIDHALAFFITCRQSLAGRRKGFTSLTRQRTRRAINGNASEWLGAVDGLPAVHERLRPVVVENMDAVKLIRREDTPGTLFYCDPPYVHNSRATTGEYAHEMTDEQHRKLIETLANIQGKFILSGYENSLYADFFKGVSHKRYDFSLPNNAAGGAEKRRMTECVWCNF